MGDKCPRCGSETSEIWTSGRRLMLACVERHRCFWSGEPYTPPKQEIRTKRDTLPADPLRWVVEGFDQYGHTFVYASGCWTREEAFEEARWELGAGSRIDGYGPCVVVIYEPGKLEGVVFDGR